MINSLEKTLYGCILYTRDGGRPAAKGTGIASSSGLSRDKREMRATGDEHEARGNTGAFPSSIARPFLFQQRDVSVRGTDGNVRRKFWINLLRSSK